MVSALQAQLAKAASSSAHASLLADRDKRGKRRAQSYLFSARDADTHDLAVLHSLGLNGIARLVVLNKNLAQWEPQLFSHAARDTDRTLLDKDASKELDDALDGFLLALTPYVLDSAAGKALEWLVRRFRINEFNVEAVLRLFTPYHESQHFAKMLNILHIESSSTWAFLVPYKNAAKSLPRAALVAEMHKTPQVARFVASILPEAVKADATGDAVVSFNASVMLDYFSAAAAGLNEETLAFVLPALVAPLSGTNNCMMGSLLLLAALAQKCRLAPAAVRSVLKSVVKAKRAVSPTQLQATLVAVTGRQEQLEDLPKNVVDVLVANADAIPDTLQLEGSERLFVPLCAALVPTCAENEAHAEALRAIVNAPAAPEDVLRALCALLFASAPSSSLLGAMKQRRPEIFAACVAELGEAADDIVLAASMPGAKGRARMFVAASDADAAVRAAGVREMVQALSTGSAEDEDAARTHLLARVADPSAAVLDALYAQPAVLLRAVPAADLFAAILAALRGDVPKAAAKAHLSFVAAHGSAEDVSRTFWPWLLRRKRADMVWEILGASKGDALGLLRGCPAVASEDEGASVGAVAQRIAENVLAAPELEPQTGFLFQMAQADEPHAAVLALLVLRALLLQMSGAHQLDLAARVVDACAPRVVADDWPRDPQAFAEYVAEPALFQAAASKASKPATAQRALAALLFLVPAIPLPAGSVDWFAPAQTHVDRVRSVYAIPAPALRALVLRARGADALLFLFGVVLHDPRPAVRAAALRHVGAFVNASADGEQMKWDVQIVLPALLLALGDDDQAVRRSAAVAVPPVGGRDPKAVYGYDAVYGARTELVQYLDWADVTRFVREVAEHKEHFVQDPGFLAVFLQQVLRPQPRETAQAGLYKQRVLCFLCSHAVACAGAATKVALLRALEHVSDGAQAAVLQPLLAEVGVGADVAAPEERELARLVASAYNVNAAALLQEDGALWAGYVDALERCGADDAHTFTVFVKQLKTGLFAALDDERQQQLAKALLKIGVTTTSSDVYTAVKTTITATVTDVQLIVSLLREIRPSSATSTEERASKRPKTTDATPEIGVQSLTLFAEALVSQKLSGNSEVVICLLETLAGLAEVPGKNYTQQLVMKALDICAESAPGHATPGRAVRLDVLVDIIRSAENPQTFHQALLLFAKMARLAPESMVYNIMPVFTFMGSNVVQRDDSYSFRVVQKTLEMIVPVMVTSLKSTNASGAELHLAARPLLKSLTDAAVHIPRHRRTTFFTQLVQSLGPDDFLEPVCLLLVDMHTKKVVRQTGEDLRNTLALPLAVLGHFKAPQQLHAVADTLRECQQLLAVVKSDATARSFLHQVAPDQGEASSSPSATATKQVHAVMVFVRESFAALARAANLAKDKGISSTLKDCILLVMNLITDLESHEDTRDIAAVASSALFTLLSISPVKTFIASVMELIRQEKSLDSVPLREALAVLGERLPQVSQAARKEISPVMRELVGLLCTALRTPISTDPAGHILALKTLRPIAVSSLPEESASLADAVHVVLDVASDEALLADAIALVAVLIPKLGPRMVAHFRAVVNFCVQASHTSSDYQLQESVENMLVALLTTLPLFWGSVELDAVLSLALEQPMAYQTLRRQLAKRVPAGTLVSALSQTWKKVFVQRQTAQPAQAVSAFFDLARRSIRTASRDDVASTLKAWSAMFLNAFDLRNPHSDGLNAEFTVEAEDAIISAFIQLVIKLNEVAFTPVFRQLYDWAFSEDSPSSRIRKITFARLISSLLDTFKGLMDPYIVLTMDGIADVLRLFTDDAADLELWLNTVLLVRRSLATDDSAYWRDDRIRKFMPVLVDQISALSNIRGANTQHQNDLAEALSALVHAAVDSAVLKEINLAILMHTRSDDFKVRLLALVCADTVWREHGILLQEFAAETETFTLECAEDDNDDVCKAARRLQKAVDAAQNI